MWWFWMVALAQTTPESLVVDRAARVWADRDGRVEQARLDGARSSSRSVGLGPSAAFVDSQVGERSQRQFQVGLEQPLDLGTSRERLAKMGVAVAVGEQDAQRFLAGLEGHEAWAEWWTARLVRDHLAEHLEALKVELLPFTAALEEKTLSAADHADLQAGVLMVQRELLQAERVLAAAEERARQRMGVEPLPEGRVLEGELPASNPWDGLPTGDPRVDLALERGEQARVTGRVVGAARLPTLQAGVMWAPDPSDTMVPFATLGASIPLQTGLTAERRRLRGEAAALGAEADRERLRIERSRSLERVTWQAMHDQVLAVREGVLGPLETRAERLREAALQKLVPLSRSVQASRDLHEAEHEWLLLRAELLTSTSRAYALRALLESR